MGAGGGWGPQASYGAGELATLIGPWEKRSVLGRKCLEKDVLRGGAADAGGYGATGPGGLVLGAQGLRGWGQKCRKTLTKKDEFSIFFMMGMEGGTQIYTAFRDFILKIFFFTLD